MILKFENFCVQFSNWEMEQLEILQSFKKKTIPTKHIYSGKFKIMFLFEIAAQRVRFDILECRNEIIETCRTGWTRIWTSLEGSPGLSDFDDRDLEEYSYYAK